MLPNHAPLQVAEAFGTLASLHPGRIDLGLGRAPGTDQPTARALRRYFEGADRFPQDVAELLGYFEPVAPGQAVQAVPGGGVDVPVWLLGSSLFSARLAQRWDFHSPSPRISRRMQWTRRWPCTTVISGPRGGCNSRTRCWH